MHHVVLPLVLMLSLLLAVGENAAHVILVLTRQP